MIEQLIKDLTEAIKENTEAVKASQRAPGIVGVETKTEKPAPEKKTKAKKKAAPKAEKDEPKTEDNVVSLEDTRKAMIALAAAKGRPAVKEILDAYDARNIGEVPKDKWAIVKHACEEKLAA